MSGKVTDRKALLRASMKAEATSVAQRFAAAEAIMERHPQGLVGGLASTMRGTAPDTFSAESQQKAGWGDGRDVSGAVDRALKRINLDQVDDNPFNARQIYDPEVIRERAASIKTHGQRVPALACADWQRPGRYILIDGHYRKRALLAIGATEIECIIENVRSELDLYRLSFLLNAERNAQSSIDNALAWRRLLEEKTITSEESLVELTGLSWSTVNKTLALLKLPDAVLSRIRERADKFGVAIGYEIFLFAKSSSEAATLALIDRVVQEDLSSREVEAIRKKRDSQHGRKPKEVSRQYKIRVDDGVQIGVIKEWDSGKVALEVTLKDQREREALLAELKRRFNLGDIDS
jgi:ParB family chromosome partitioning protein